MQEHKQNQITVGMSDDERYELLKDRTLNIPFVDVDKLAQIDPDDYDALKNIGKSGAFKLLRRIGEDFGVFRDDYTTQDVDVEFQFSKRNLQESIHIHNQRGKFCNYALLLTILETVNINAVGIEVHNERYNYPGSQLDAFYVCISAFTDNEYIVPVLLEIKTYTDETAAALYVALSLREIKRSRILGHTQDTKGVKSYPSPTSITVSLSDLLSNVNVSDKNLLKYIPNGFLNGSQKEAKQIALKETMEYIDKKNKQRFSRTEKTMHDDWFVSEPDVNYLTDENCIEFVFRKKVA